MNLFLRLLWHAFAWRLRSRRGLLDPVRTPFRVWPTDLDVLRHVNNGVYFSIMDIARLDLIRRAGAWKPIVSRGWYPVVVAETIQFRRSLTLFQRFEIETRVLGWDDKAVLIEQRFIRPGARGGEEVVSAAVLRGVFLSRAGGVVPISELLSALEVNDPAPELPGWVARWNADQVALREAARAVGERAG